MNLLVDNIVLQVLGGGAGFLVGILYALSRGADQGALSSDEATRLQIGGYLIGIVVALAYYAGSEMLFQRTLAKFLTGTIVVTADGGRPSTGQILGRTLCRFIPFDAFSYLGTPCVGWHDSISKTRVVDAR